MFTWHYTWAGHVLGVSSTRCPYCHCTWSELQINLGFLRIPPGQWFKALLRSILDHFVTGCVMSLQRRCDEWRWRTILALSAQMGSVLCSMLQSTGNPWAHLMSWMAPEIIAWIRDITFMNKSALLGKVAIYTWEMQIPSFLAEWYLSTSLPHFSSVFENSNALYTSLSRLFAVIYFIVL